MIRVLCPEPENFSSHGLDYVCSFAKVDARTINQSELCRALFGYDAVMVRTRLKLSNAELTSNPLKAILSPTTGLDHIDLESTERHGISVFSIQGAVDFLETITSTAEYTLGLMLALVRRIPYAFDSVRRNVWEQHAFRGMELVGKTLGVLGLGRVGRQIAGFGQALGMKVIAFDPYCSMVPRNVRKEDSLYGFLSMCDILTVHVPLNSETRGMLGPEELYRLPRGAYIINTSRGAIVDEQAMQRLLESGHLAGAAVDVVVDESSIALDANPLVRQAKRGSNLLITPHIAGAAQQAMEKTDRYVIDLFKEWLRSKGYL